MGIPLRELIERHAGGVRGAGTIARRYSRRLLDALIPAGPDQPTPC